MNIEKKENGFKRENKAGKGMPALISPFMLERLSKLLEKGADMYGARNWEQGDYYSNFTNSAFRHLMGWMKGDNSEDHLAAIIFNIQAIIHMQETGQDKDFNDMPTYNVKKPKETLNLQDFIDIAVEEYMFNIYNYDINY